MRRATVLTTLLALVLFSASFTTGFAASPVQTGIATCYARRLSHHRTSSGKRYNPNALTAAHHTIANGTNVKVTNLENGRSVVVLIDDRLRRHAGRGIIIDLSHRACTKLEFGREKEARVKVEVLDSTEASDSH
jgi:rare lipoprotein A